MKDEARLIFEKYRALPGSEQIATDFAIKGLLWWLRREHPKKVLEVGGGIGTLTETILKVVPHGALAVIEDNAWCREQLACNTGMVAIEQVPSAVWFDGTDFFVIDGEQLSLNFSNPIFLYYRGVIFAEGNRRPERAAFELFLRRASASWTSARWRRWDRSKGYWVLIVRPTGAERLWFAWVRLREWAMDWLLGRAFGRTPGWRRRNTDPAA